MGFGGIHRYLHTPITHYNAIYFLVVTGAYTPKYVISWQYGPEGEEIISTTPSGITIARDLYFRAMVFIRLSDVRMRGILKTVQLSV